MTTRFLAPILIAMALALAQCTSPEGTAFVPQAVHRTAGLIVEQISPNAFIHTSYKQTQDFGNVPCNGLVVRSGGEAIVFDTPTTDRAATELIRWVQDSLHCRITAVIPTHFHDDCLGGLTAFHAHGIPSYAHHRTMALAAADSAEVPMHGFSEPLTLQVGSEHITATFHGEGHTKDNVVGYFPGERVLFGGCLIKELDASKGYLGDANVAAWSGTVEAVKKAYPGVKVVVPGHGQYGDGQLLDYTIGLFQYPQ